MTSEPNCVFCKIVAGQIPAEKIYEDEKCLGLMDIRPQSPGHVVLIPKAHQRWVWDIAPIGDFFTAAQKIVRAQQKCFGTDSVWAKVVGEEVPHAHLWLFPNPKEATGNPSDLKGNAEKICAALK